MSGFQFETGPQEGTNRSAAATDCQTCGGDRFVPVEQPELKVDGRDGGYTDAMMRCPACNHPLHNASGGNSPASVERRWEP